MDLEKNAKDIMDRAQNQWWNTGTYRRTKDIDNNTGTKTEKNGWDICYTTTHY